MIINKSHLRKVYTIEELAYLDSAAAAPIYQLKADIIRLNNYQGIVDVGCRLGSVNQYLSDHQYQYYGFDTSPDPVLTASSTYPNHKFEIASWNSPPPVNFSVDVVIFGSVLIYDPEPSMMFERLCKFYQPSAAIIHEVSSENTEDLPYTDLEYFTNKYTCELHHLELEIPCSKRTIIHVQYK